MKRKYLLFSLLLAGSSLYAQEWPAVRPEARPATRWWWLGSAVDATNLTYNLEEYAKAGLGGVEITPIYGVQGNDKNNLPFLSPQWMNMFLFASLVTTKRLRACATGNNTTFYFLTRY